jgi:antitoxin MazE
MKTKVQRWGNSLALRIPRSYAAETRISEGSDIELTTKSGTLLIRPLIRKRHLLGDLLKKITRANQHGSVDTGKVVGRETW